MTNKFALIAATVAALSATAPAFANSQLIASAGLTPAQAEGLTLNEIAAAKYNSGKSFSNRQAVVVERGVSGDPAGLEAFAIANYNAGKSQADRQEFVSPSGVSVSSRSVVTSGSHTQLIASAGLTQEEAKGLTLNEIVAAKYNKNRSYSDRQRVGNTY
jgi:hypothetical protein